VRTDAALWAWGDHSFGQTAQPSLGCRIRCPAATGLFHETGIWTLPTGTAADNCIATN